MVAISRSAFPGHLDAVVAIAGPFLARYRPNAAAANAELLRVYKEIMLTPDMWENMVRFMSVPKGYKQQAAAMVGMAKRRYSANRQLMSGLYILGTSLTLCSGAKLLGLRFSCEGEIDGELRRAQAGDVSVGLLHAAAEHGRPAQVLREWFAVDERAPAAPAAALAPLPCTYCGKELAPEVAMKCTPKDGKDCPTKAVYCNVDCQRADWKAGHKEVHRAAAVGGARKRRSTQRKRSTRRSTRRH